MLVRLRTDRVSTVLICNLFALFICRSISMLQFCRSRRISTVQICSVDRIRESCCGVAATVRPPRSPKRCKTLQQRSVYGALSQ